MTPRRKVYKAGNLLSAMLACVYSVHPYPGFAGIGDTQAQAKGMNNMRHSAFTHDLYNAIAGGDYPEWTFYVQLLDPEEQDKLDFDPLDATKV